MQGGHSVRTASPKSCAKNRTRLRFPRECGVCWDCLLKRTTGRGSAVSPIGSTCLNRKNRGESPLGAPGFRKIARFAVPAILFATAAYLVSVVAALRSPAPGALPGQSAGGNLFRQKCLRFAQRPEPCFQRHGRTGWTMDPQSRHTRVAEASRHGAR